MTVSFHFPNFNINKMVRIMVPSSLPFLVIPILAILCPCPCHGYSKEDNGNKIKGMFVFGSSLVDNGNNNFLPNSMAKANYFPYGIDFPYGPSGRFTNGKNVVDLLCEKLGLPLIPAFADPSTKGNKIIHGVNFASAASGILDDTGLIAREVISLKEQIKNFEEVTMAELEAEEGNKLLVRDYMFVVGTGGNDYSFNYFLKPFNANVTLEAFTANLTNSLSAQLQRLYKFGARKFVLMSVNPIGCYPMVMANRPTHRSGCIQNLNEAARLFNAHLKSLVVSIKPLMPSSHLVFVNSYKIIQDLIKTPLSKGFKDASNPCCEVASISEGGNGSLCKKGGKVCRHRTKHVFFDGLHPTEAVNVVIAAKAFDSELQSDIYPMNVRQLAMQ